MKTIEICAGAGGQAIGLHHAGAKHVALVEIDEYACKTLRLNNDTLKLGWGEIFEGDLAAFNQTRAKNYTGDIDLIAGGVPCPPFSKAGKQLGAADERNLFPKALELIEIVRPTAVMIENVPGLMDRQFQCYREKICNDLKVLGYRSEWKKLQASDFGVPQLRPRAVLVAFDSEHFSLFKWPIPLKNPPPTVGEALYGLMASNGWAGAQSWKMKANRVAPTLVGGSKKHGGPDLGPTRAKKQWQTLGVNGHRVGASDEIPDKGFHGVRMRDGSIRAGYENLPALTLDMAAKLQGFPDTWQFFGSKTHAYRQIGNAFPPPVAEAVGREIAKVIAMISQRPKVDDVQAAE